MYMGPIGTIGYLMQHTASVMYRQSDQILQERLGIGMSQFKILMVLQEHPSMQQRALADFLGQTEASISRQIKLLCEKGMLTVEVNAKNRREHITKPTVKGLKLSQASQDILQEYHAPTFDQFSDKERQQLTEMLSKIHVIACGPRKPIACDRPFEL
jgi:DNA-binding MarR family transcriptional regulator